MTHISIKIIGENLARAGRLTVRPLCIYGSETVPEGGIPTTEADRCVAKAMLMAAVNDDMPPLYIGKETLKGSCFGGSAWLGFMKSPPFIRYFVSTGSSQFRDGAAEYLKASPDIFDKTRENVGTITPPGKYLVIQACEDIEDNIDVRSFLCFGNGEQIRNMSSLIHFNSTDPFFSVLEPWGPSCATFATYPAGLAEKAPKDAAFIGPVDPTGNCWLPENFMAIGIPVKIATGLVEDIDKSFIGKRPQVAYPEDREKIKKS
ncbi:hypothetical protein CUJ83_08485 [Methanocella sp. CWC-04]|uniref:DUF169 domain-containing protein n=1 Tax=Methanooceanicella nereidis TaxID=2052831 RepID=A0AAP2W692_9EURY|nr:DUF169 domain-containing protein [Methanocella sp. CWC-04]MCD1295032.1 hypothetical protein [Methanocella sp. CWC-04]